MVNQLPKDDRGAWIQCYPSFVQVTLVGGPLDGEVCGGVDPYTESIVVPFRHTSGQGHYLYKRNYGYPPPPSYPFQYAGIADSI
jgi:hypothetical protein